VEVKAHHPAEGLGHAAGQFHHILAAQIIAAFGQIEGAAMDGEEEVVDDEEEEVLIASMLLASMLLAHSLYATC
jgi:hypothetical protein